MSHPETASAAEFARIAERTRSYITELKAAGRLVLTEDGKRIRVAESLARIAATRDPSKEGVAARHEGARNPVGHGEGLGAIVAPAAGTQDDEDDTQATSGYQHWRERSERAKALGLERENRLRDRELLDAAEVVAAVTAAIATLRTRLESLPDVLGPQLAAEVDEGRVRALMAETIEHALDDTARRFQALGKAEAEA